LVGPECNAPVVRQRLVVASHQASGARPGASRPDFRPNEPTALARRRPSTRS